MERVQEGAVQVGVSLQIVVSGRTMCSVHIVPEETQCSAVNEADEKAKASNTSCQYSGRHDNGLLPTLRDTGPHARLFTALQV
jgi:hypothetical protein